MTVSDRLTMIGYQQRPAYKGLALTGWHCLGLFTKTGWLLCMTDYVASDIRPAMCVAAMGVWE